MRQLPQFSRHVSRPRAALCRVGLCFLFANNAFASTYEATDQLLRNADSVKMVNRGEFSAALEQLDRKQNDLTDSQAQFLRYLKSWQSAYDGEYETAISTLKGILVATTDVTLQFRARATIVNVLLLTKRFEEAFSQLSLLLKQLPQVRDRTIREQGLAVAALLYNQVGQYDLALHYADMITTDSSASSGKCRGGQFRMEALYKSAKLREVGGELQEAIDTCVKASELIRANVIRSFAAKIYIEQRRYDNALRLLNEHYVEVKAAGYSHLVSEYDSLLAQTYLKKNQTELARQFAAKAILSAAKGEYTAPIVSAYQVLYTAAKQRGDLTSALEYHEKYAAADKAYLDNVSASQLAYQRATHEALANKSQIEGLNKQNEVLTLQRALSDKAVENSRLYILILTMVLVFFVLFAYKIKRSQLHFKNLSRLDGLTGIVNRLHFIELADRALQDSKITGQGICVVVCDLDHFKKINDTCGHAAGDAVLKSTAQVFQEQLRKNDIVGRVGGEEFGIVLTDCDATTAHQRCEQLRLAFTEIVIPNSSAESKLSASFGIAVTASSGYELRQLLADADVALYQAKRNGRNRVVQHNAGFASGTPQSTMASMAIEALSA